MLCSKSVYMTSRYLFFSLGRVVQHYSTVFKLSSRFRYLFSLSLDAQFPFIFFSAF